MNYFKRLVNVLLVAIVLCGIPGSLHAQSTDKKANGFRISPIRTELTIEKGSSQIATVSLENPSSIPLKAKAVINDFEASDTENGQPRLLLDGEFAKSHSLKRLVADPPTLELGPNERKEVKILISIPSNAAAGGYYGAVRFLPAEVVSGGNVALSASVGSLFLVNVPGNIKMHLELLDFGAAVNGNIKKIITSGQISIVTRLKNNGDTHEKPFGRIQIKDSKGKLVADEEINNIEPQSNILPGSIRKFETQLKNKKWLGHYTVTAGFGYTPSNSELINAKSSFWYIPSWMFIAAIVMLVLLLVTGYIIVRKIKRTKRSR